MKNCNPEFLMRGAYETQAVNIKRSRMDCQELFVRLIVGMNTIVVAGSPDRGGVCR